MKFIFPMPNSLSSNAELLSEFQKAEGRELCLAQSKNSILSPSQASFVTQRTIPTIERKWKVFFLPTPRMEELCQQRSPKWLQKKVRHYDQDGRQSDAALHWDTIRRVLLKAFAKHGARDFSDQQWLRLIHEREQQDKIRAL